MLKKMLGILLSVALVVSLTGCTSKSNDDTKNSSSDSSNEETSSNSSNSTGTSGNAEEPYTLTVAWPVYGDAPQDLNMVQEKVNEITLEKLNMKMEFKPVSVTAMANTYSLAVSSGEKLDLISMCPTVSITQYIRDKMIIPLDDLVAQYGSDIKSGLGDAFAGGMFSDKLYVIATKEPLVNGGGVILLDSIIKKYNIDVTKIKTLDDLDPIFEMVHAGEPDMTMFYPFGVTAYLCNFDGQPNGLLNQGLDSTTYTNVFESDEYRAVVKKMREWYEKGYISKDFATIQSSANQLMDANKLFCGIGPTNDLNTSMGESVPKYQITLVNPVQRGTGGGAFTWAIPVTAKNPEKSIQFLNLVFQDPELANLLQFGIEGVHYTKNSDGTIDSSMNTTYKVQRNIWGNPDTYYIKQSDLVGVGGSLDEYNRVKEAWKQKVNKSKSFGFLFDTSPVKNEFSAVSAVYDQYEKLLEGGALDPEKYLDLMNEKAYDAGLQKIIDENQKQFDEWQAKQ